MDAGLLDDAVAALRAQYDPVHGGFGGAPKFPPASAIEFLLRRGETEMSTHTLREMASGGMYDQVGGGFARYSVDSRWLVPHFEKMLYDNALLARAYLHGWLVTGDRLFRRVCEETLDWALREMRAPEGGFFSALDADSEGEEGKFYVWSLDELREVAGEEAAGWFGASERGNFEGHNILVRGSEDDPPERDDWRRKLYERRADRVWPGLDDKRLTSWNALMLSALAEAGAVLGRDDYVSAARDCAEFLLRDLRDDGGRLLRTYKDGRAHLNAYLEDHAYLLEALLTLYESSFEPRWFGEARSLADTTIERFADDENGGFFDTSSDHEQLLARRKDLEDHPIPAGNSSAAYGLLRLAALSGEHEYESRAVLGLPAAARGRRQAPAGLRPPAPGARLPLLPHSRGRARGRRSERAGAGRALVVPPPSRAGRRRRRRRAAAPGPASRRRPCCRLRLRALRLQGARDRARSARGAASLRVAAAALALFAGATAAARSEEPAYRGAVRIAHEGVRPAGSRAEGRAHAAVKRAFRRAGLRVAVQRFPVAGHGRSRNVIGMFRTPHTCLRIVMAHADTTAFGPGANDNASGVGVVMSLAPRLRRIQPACDVWLVATGAEERIYTGSPDHLGALALARRVRGRGLRRRLRWALSLDEVGRGRAFWLRSPVTRARRSVEVELVRAARRSGASVRWVRDEGSGNSDHREFQLLGLRAAKLGVDGHGEPCRHKPCDRTSRLQRGALRGARRAVERALRSPT